MACPNKKEDEKIIAEIAKRKEQREVTPPEYTYEHLIYDGNIQDIQMFAIDQNDIVTITNHGNRQWDVMYKRKT